MSCKRLIEYLNSLQSQMTSTTDCVVPATCTASEKRKASADESDDSAEEYPESFVTLRASLSLPARAADNDENTDKETSFVNVLKKK
ncbi:unnamed protein product, partial [Gongylonema pulchrum]|uniref:BHLH domain-containing protein n=1 Tax=Gongylonema pulchrum TaxID=637853 RepID=A0A183EKU3_9BILA